MNRDEILTGPVLDVARWASRRIQGSVPPSFYTTGNGMESLMKECDRRGWSGACQFGTYPAHYARIYVSPEQPPVSCIGASTPPEAFLRAFALALLAEQESA